MPKRLLTIPTAIALLISSLGATAAYADSVPTDPEPTWQTNGELVDGKNPTGTVYATIIGRGASDGLVFVAGNFSSLKAPRGKSGTIARAGVAAVNKSTGAVVTTFDAGLKAASGRVEIRSLELSGDGSTLYIGGDFQSVRGQTRRNLAAVDALSGAPRSFVANTTAGVKAMVRSGNRLFIGGDFDAVNGQSRARLAAVDARSGIVLSGFRADVSQVQGTCPPRCSPNVTALAVSNSTLYIGGHFGAVKGVARNSAAAVDTTSGAVKAFNPDVFHRVEGRPGAANRVYDLEVWNDRVFICGDFWAVGDAVHPNIAAVDAVSGRNKSGWLSSTDGAVNACDINPNSGVLYLAGHFDKVGGEAAGQLKPGYVVRIHVAKFDPVSGDPAGWNPVLNSTAGAYALDSELNRVVVGGQFTTVNSKEQQGFAIFD